MGVVLLFGLVIGFLAIGVPIAVSLGLSSIIFLLLFSDASLGSVAQTLFNAFAGHFTLLAIPFFILASTFMSTGGVASDRVRASIKYTPLEACPQDDSADVYRLCIRGVRASHVPPAPV